MTPAQHVRESERELAFANQSDLGNESAYHLAAAQVHATLALVGATILGALPGYDTARHELGDAISEAKQ